MRPHNRAIEQKPFAIGIVRTVFKDLLPDSFVAPAGETLVYAIPFAIRFRQEPPLGTAAGDPQHRFDEAARIEFIPGINAGARFQKGIDGLPSRVR